MKKVIEKIQRVDWLLENGVKESDVMWDEESQEEYIMSEIAMMDEGEPEVGGYKKVYLPDFK